MNKEFVRLELKKTEIEAHVKEVLESAAHQHARERKRLLESTEPILRRYIAANPETPLLNEALLSLHNRISTCDLKTNIAFAIAVISLVLQLIQMRGG